MPLLDRLGNLAGCISQDFSVGRVLLVTYDFIPKAPCSQHLHLPWLLHIEAKTSQLHTPTSGTAEKNSEPVLHCWTSPLKFGGGSPASVTVAPHSSESQSHWPLHTGAAENSKANPGEPTSS